MSEESNSPFPEGFRGALSLAFDDGWWPSQLRLALPMLNDNGLKATLYLSPIDSRPGRDDWLERLAPYARAAEDGHEIGNHTLSHICSRAHRATMDGPCLEAMTLSDLEADILAAQQRLTEGTGTPPRTFAYPCYHEHVGEGPSRQSYVPLIAKHFVAGRGAGEFANIPLTCDLHYLWSTSAEAMTGPALVGMAVRAAMQGKWQILDFHGIDEGHLSVPRVAFHELLVFLSRHNSDIWVAPVVEVAERIVEWRSLNHESTKGRR